MDEPKRKHGGRNYRRRISTTSSSDSDTEAKKSHKNEKSVSVSKLSERRKHYQSRSRSRSRSNSRSKHTSWRMNRSQWKCHFNAKSSDEIRRSQSRGSYLSQSSKNDNLDRNRHNYRRRENNRRNFCNYEGPRDNFRRNFMKEDQGHLKSDLINKGYNGNDSNFIINNVLPIAEALFQNFLQNGPNKKKKRRNRKNRNVDRFKKF